MTPAPGEGERRAQRGYVPQYDLTARVIYEALAAGRLNWVGLADRGAGTFDDVVLGLRDRIAAHQIKTSRDPEPFNIKTVLLGANKLLARMLDSRQRLERSDPGLVIETIFACDDYPRTDDNIVGIGGSGSSSAFIRTHEARRSSWTLQDWRNSQFGPFVQEVQRASGLDDTSFETAWRNMQFLVGGRARDFDAGHYGDGDHNRLKELAALLPRLVADPADRDRWSPEDLRGRLSWHDPFALRHGHSFPVDALYQSNAPTQQKLQETLARTSSGYISLVGPPGAGKSTLLAAGLLPTPRARVLQYLAFVPDERHGLGRAEAFDFLHDIITQFKHQGFGSKMMPGSDLNELRTQFEALLTEASGRFHVEQTRTLIVVDGLDHIQREENPTRSLLSELPLPHAVPQGVIFVLGTQKLDLDGLSQAVRDEAACDERCINVGPLPRDAVTRWVDAAGIPDDVDRGEIYERSKGHPLSTRYVIHSLLNAPTSQNREDWLRSGPTYGGDVNVFYERAWRDLERCPEARRALSYLALAEGPIRPISLDYLVGSAATDAAWKAASHLMERDRHNGWSVFHNSFRLFLRARTSLRHGVLDEAGVRQRYIDLAEMASGADNADPQRWMELRYRARADDYAAVAQLALPQRFRAQFIEGRDPADIRDDIKFAFKTAGALREPSLTVDLILVQHEISMRADALGDEVFDALIALGELERVLGLLNAEGVSLTVGKGYELVDAFLQSGEAVQARKLFDRLEPVEKLLGSEPVDLHPSSLDLEEWAERALIFREPNQLLAALARLNPRDDALSRLHDADRLRVDLKLVAARGQLMRNPQLPLNELMESLQIEAEYEPLLHYFAAEYAFQLGDDALAADRLESAAGEATRLPEDARRSCAERSALLNRADLVNVFLNGVPSPSLADHDSSYDHEELKRMSRQVFLHASLRARMGHCLVPGSRSRYALLGTYQHKLETLGRLHGEGNAGRLPHLEPLRELRAILDFLEHAEGEEHADLDRRRLDGVLDETLTIMVETGAALGPGTYAHLTSEVDSRIQHNTSQLSRVAVRRAYAIAAFRHEHIAESAARRVDYERKDVETTPGEQIAEAARTATAFVAFGLNERAHRILSDIHHDGLGYSRRAKKDPQYLVWRDLLRRACEEDPAGRPDRLRFFGRFLDGMSTTEGDDAGRRLVTEFLDQAAQAGPALARAAADRIEEIGLATWPKLVAGLLRGVVMGRPDLATASAILFGRVALPFTDEYDDTIYPALISTAPADQLEALVRHAAVCIETDGHVERRVGLLQEIVNAAANRGVLDGIEALARWRTELPVPADGRDADNPFATVGTLDELAAVISRDDENSWGAIAAFERIAPISDYDRAKALFETVEILRENDRSIDVLATLALKSGRITDVENYLERLRRPAEERGGWSGGWRSDSKYRLHRLLVQMQGEVARQSAFDSLVEDLALGREYVEWLLPDLCDVLDLISPQPTWADVWSRFSVHLAQFREYRIGREMEQMPHEGTDDPHTLADILYRAIDTTSTELARMVRVAARELTNVPGGPTVVAALLPRLWQAGGNHALEAAQIAWECRDSARLRDLVRPWFQSMADSDDYAVRRTAVRLMSFWWQERSPKRASLPAIYNLELPPNPHSVRFEPPSGSSPYSSGLWTEDSLAWTWPLEDALDLTVKASGQEMVNVRARAAQLMARIGGVKAFGPQAVEQQQTRFRRLRLHVTHHKLGVISAYTAMREVIGELVAADAIDPAGVPYILRAAAGFDPIVLTSKPSPRPRGVPRPAMAELYSSSGTESWRASAQADALVPTIDGFVVLASTAVHERQHFKDRWIIEQYTGPDLDVAEQGLSWQLLHLPRVVICGGIAPLYDDLAEGAVVHPHPDRAGSIGAYTLMLCPRVAQAVGWRVAPQDPFTYCDQTGRVVAQTICWRDGGVLSREVGCSTSRGWLLIVPEDCAKLLQPFLSVKRIAIAWRATEKVGEGDRSVTSGSQQINVAHCCE